MQQRRLGQTGPSVSALGLGCMGMSGMYGPADRQEGIATIHAALEAGITLLDTGDFYGMGHNEMLIGEALLGLATLVCDLGPTRLGVCAAERCTNVYVDTSPNQSRRYCSERCSSRANVAAYRARQKAASA